MKKIRESGDAVERRASVILRVQVGLLTASEGARELGVSRKTYYQWENRALSALVKTLQDGSGGRPKRRVDEEKAALKKRVEELEAKDRVRAQVERIREVLGGAKGAAQKK